MKTKISNKKIYIKKKSRPAQNGSRKTNIYLDQLKNQNLEFQKIIREKEQDVYRLEVLGQIKQSVLVDQTPQEFASKTFDLLNKLIPHDHANVILFNFKKNRARVLAIHGNENIGIFPGDVFPLEECFANWGEIKEGRIQLDQSTLSPQPLCLLDKKLQGIGIQSHISLLLISHNEIVGSLNIASFQPAAFDNKSLRMARDVADSLAVAIQKATLFEETRIKAAELESLADLSSALRRAEKWTEIIHMMVRTSMQFMNASHAGFIWSENQRVYTISLDSRLAPENFKEGEWPANQKIIELLKLNNSIFETGIESEHVNSLPLPFSAQSVAVLPVKTVGVMAGKLFLAFETKKEFSKEDRRLLTSMADIAGNALYRANILETLEQRVSDRTRELSTLYSITNIISRSLDLQSTLDQCLKSISEALGAEIGFIHFYQRDTQLLLRQVSEGWTQKESPEENHFFRSLFDKQHPLLNTDFTPPHFNSHQIAMLIKYPSFISAPIFGRQGVLGLISFFSSKSTAFNHEELSLLTSVANHISIAVENNRLHQKADEAIVIEERQRLARELHDSISQLLYSQLLFSEASLKLVHSGDTELLTSYLHRLADVADQAFKEMRLMIYSLRPKVLESVGLSGALQHRLNTVEQRAGMETKFSVKGVDNLPSQVEDGLFRIAQEALNNALKHASATAITVRLEQEEPFIELEVSDNGIGFEREAIVEGIGIASMQERAKQLGGDLMIASTPGMGTSIRVKLNYSNMRRKIK